MAEANVTVYGGSAAPTLLGQGPARIPTGGKIRAGIKVLTRKAAEHPQARALYEQGVAAGQSFEQIERAISEALPQLETPLIPRNVAWFTVRPQDFANPQVAHQIMDAYGEDRGEGCKLYRFPVVFPSDHWQTVMPHELAAWGTHDKHYWSQYTPVPTDETGRRTIRIFGGRKTMRRDANGGLCEPEVCPEYQRRQCNLSGRFLFFIPGIRAITAFELHTNSFYAMNAAIQKFETIGFLRGGRISGFLDRQRTPFFITKKLMEVTHIDEQGRAVRVPQWIIDLEAPVDVAALLREHDDAETVIAQAEIATQVLDAPASAEANSARAAARQAAGAEPAATGASSHPTLQQVLERARACGLDAERYQRYAALRWGAGWKLNPRGRATAWRELERYANDPHGYADKVDTELRALA
jgi:hypothetical protein